MDRAILPYMSRIAIYANNTMLTIGMSSQMNARNGQSNIAIYVRDCHICQ